MIARCLNNARLEAKGVSKDCNYVCNPVGFVCRLILSLVREPPLTYGCESVPFTELGKLCQAKGTAAYILPQCVFPDDYASVKNDTQRPLRRLKEDVQ